MNKKVLIAITIVFSLLVFIALILTPLYKKPQVLKGKIAIVIDDWGYHLNNLETAKSIKQPLTCAVLPNLKNSSLVAKKLKNSGFEIILHLPMQPKEKFKLEVNTITLAMNPGQISSILDKDLVSVKYAKGVSNHMGSGVTENKKIMEIILTRVKKHKLYFLDSYVTAGSVCGELAKNIGVKFAKRDVFLDNQNDPEYIKAQLLKLKNLAAKQGSAIGIGHDRKNTLAILKEIIPQLVKDGYKFVYVSELVQ